MPAEAASVPLLDDVLGWTEVGEEDPMAGDIPAQECAALRLLTRLALTGAHPPGACRGRRAKLAARNFPASTIDLVAMDELTGRP